MTTMSAPEISQSPMVTPSSGYECPDTSNHRELPGTAVAAGAALAHRPPWSSSGVRQGGPAATRTWGRPWAGTLTIIAERVPYGPVCTQAADISAGRGSPDGSGGSVPAAG